MIKLNYSEKAERERNMARTIATRIKALQQMSVAGLRREYRKVYGKETTAANKGFLLKKIARRIQELERQRVSFVSVTQQFNSSTSMGRLTLNILLSFAQFEREIIAERTRDKMCAARRRGKWTGGIPILGYDIDPQGGRLIVNQAEVERVRAIFRLYLEHQSLLSVAQELNARGWQTKSWVKRDGRRRPGKSFTKTNVHGLLNNVTYLGKVEHQGNIYEGEQEAIIDHALWAQVQQLLKHNGRPGGHLHRNKYGALLKGLVYCGHCQTAMLHTYTKKGERQYRYYTCSAAQKQGYNNCPSKSVPALEFERFVVERIKEIGHDHKILETTLRRVQAELKAKQEPLNQEKTCLQKEQAEYQKQIKNILSAMGEGEGSRTQQSSQLLAEHLGEIEEKLKRCQARLSEINRELLLIAKPSINKQDLRQALSLFDPVWEMLFTPFKLSQKPLANVNSLLQRLSRFFDLL